MKNEMNLEFDSISENEAFARVVAASFATQLNPNLEEIDDIKRRLFKERFYTIDKLCNILQCRVEDIMEHIPDNNCF